MAMAQLVNAIGPKDDATMASMSNVSFL